MKNAPIHIGIIPDGNRRYAACQRKSLVWSYTHGAQIALETARWAKAAGVRDVSFFGISNENLRRRHPREIEALREGVVYFCELVQDYKIDLHLVGNIDGLDLTEMHRKRLEDVSRKAYVGGAFTVHADINYSGDVRSELAPLFCAIEKHGIETVKNAPEKFILSAGVPPVDLVIRTGGKARLSGFLPFQTTQAQLYFRNDLWGEFRKDIFDEALRWYELQDKTLGA